MKEMLGVNCINKNTICLDSEADWLYGSNVYGNDVYDDATRFPIVRLALESTNILDAIADYIRMEVGRIPLFTPNKNGEMNDEAWYNFSIELNDYMETKVGTHIEFTVCDDIAEDDYQVYAIYLSEEERMEIYKVLDEQLHEKYGTSCVELLEESRMEMIEYKNWLREGEERRNRNATIIELEMK